MVQNDWRNDVFVINDVIGMLMSVVPGALWYMYCAGCFEKLIEKIDKLLIDMIKPNKKEME
jgi:hypothetical protein